MKKALLVALVACAMAVPSAAIAKKGDGGCKAQQSFWLFWLPPPCR